MHWLCFRLQTGSLNSLLFSCRLKLCLCEESVRPFNSMATPFLNKKPSLSDLTIIDSSRQFLHHAESSRNGEVRCWTFQTHVESSILLLSLAEVRSRAILSFYTMTQLYYCRKSRLFGAGTLVFHIQMKDHIASALSSNVEVQGDFKVSHSPQFSPHYLPLWQLDARKL